MTGSSVLDGAFSVAPFGLIKLDVGKTRTLATEKRISVDDEHCYDLSSVCALTNSVAVLAANHAAQSMLSLEGRPFSERISHIIPEKLQKPFAKGLVSLLHGKSFEFEGILKAADGVEFQAHISGWAEADGSSPDQAMLSVTKLQHHHGDDALKTGILSDLAHAARISMLGEMTAAISHEVNQPLGSIVTSAEAGLRWLNHEQPDLDEVRTLLERIVNSGRRAGNIVSTLNGLARNTKPERSPVEVARLIDEAVLILRPDLNRRQIGLRLEISPDLPTVLIDRTQILQVIVNLVTNAAQAMADGQAWNRTLAVRARETRGRVTMEVEDSGPGVDPKVRQKLFESFYTTKASGIGIGLAICRSIIEAHGSKIQLQSSQFLGARFSFDLEIARQAAPATTSPRR
ncbi:MAG: ATP-binding protein [Rhizobium sp.]|jgi:signal transduction histidine kinase|uniref:sensor histidine kinase n=1 Tax=Rhizobium sp. TaxID=391 RepID=UPI0030F06A7C